ncbi:Mur ligase family protein [Solirubrobacter soli]|uniref:Mur ligase family protein n=1 Tax=Solirubrobacter soli TaxID=363832 RepID=UPI0003F6DD75|nr:UDP-N-acetylmuramoyl-L-alanine--D-glutamate ligase [Solirubrobacter soli]
MIVRPPLPPGPYLVLGLARSGVAAARVLTARGGRVVASDARRVGDDVREALRAMGAEVRDGEGGLELLEGVATLIKSPGVPREAPLVAAALERGITVLGELELGWRLLEHPFIALTGSNGKTTTVELIGHIHRTAGVPVTVAGNVGTALTSLPGTLDPDAVIVCEASSFQLEDTLAFAPDAAVLLNLQEDHLDRHGTFANYRAAKLAIFAHQPPGALAVVPAGLPLEDAGGEATRVTFGEDAAAGGAAGDDAAPGGAAAGGEAAPNGEAAPGEAVGGEPAPGGAVGGEVAPGGAAGGDAAPGGAAAGGEVAPNDEAAPGEAVGGEPAPGGAAGGEEADLVHRDGSLFWRGEAFVRADEIRLRGPHNRENAMAAAAVCLARGIGPGAVREGLMTFAGVPHRLEEIATVGGVTYVNDSKATNVASAEVGVRSFPRGVHLIAGGSEKHSDFTPLAAPVKERCTAVYTIGQTAPRIDEALRPTGVPIDDAHDLATAFAHASDNARPGDIVLLSPGCASYDQYRSYEERGDHFRRLVENLG